MAREHLPPHPFGHMRQLVLRMFVAFLALGVVAYIVVIRNAYYHSSATERSSTGNAWLETGFTVAIVWPPHTDHSLVEGVTLAIEELNASKSPLAGKIHLKFYTEPDTPEENAELARAVVQGRDVLAVIGHERDGSAIPASVTYDAHGVLFLSPKNTDIRLTRHEFGYVFRLTPNDAAVTEAMVDYALSQGWQRIGVLYGRNNHGEAASGMFVSVAKEKGLKTAFFRSYIEEPDWVSQDFRPMIGEVRRDQFDAVMLADVLPWAAKVLVDLTRMGLEQPILATDKLDSLQVWQIAQVAANTLYVASSVDPESNSPAYVAFRARFHQRFSGDPGYGATQGYEAMRLFIDACERSHSADPVVVATTLRSVTVAAPWRGLFGDFTFTQHGDIIGRAISIKKMTNGVFTTMDSIMVNPVDVNEQKMDTVVIGSPPVKNMREPNAVANDKVPGVKEKK
jgi:branched-chain amino acid transport system substrate-binding protein